MPQHKHRRGSLFSTASSVWLLQIIGLATAYFITGKLGTFLAIPPGYATAIWPPSGIALAGILIYGYHTWPGILLGSFLVNISTTLVAGSPSETLTSIIITLAISCGASLQAVVGAYLVRRYARFPNMLTGEKDIFLFLLFGGIISAWVNPTIAVSTLMATARIPATNFLANWGTWWLGDVLGIFIFTPLVLVWMLRPGEPWRHRRMAVTLPIMATFMLTTAAVFYEAQNNNARLKLEFHQQAAELSVAVQKSISTHINVLRSLGSFYAASAVVSRKEFEIFVAHSLDNFQGIQALSWNPRILSAERAEFERLIQSEGYPNFQITERNAAKQLVRAQDRADYVAVGFIEPYSGNESALGFDVYSDSLRREAIDRARDTGEIATTARITLVQERGNQQGAIAFMPLYRKGMPHTTLEQRRNTIEAYVVAVFRGGDIISAAAKGLGRPGLSYRLIDETAPVAKQLIFTSGSKELKPFVLQEKGLFGRQLALSHSLSINVGGRHWRFEVVPTQDYFAYHHSNNAWLILLVGLILTSMVATFSMVSSGRGSVLRHLVEERTAALTQSEQRFRIVADAAPVLIWLTGTDKRYFWFNRVWLDFTGCSMEQALNQDWADSIHADDVQRCLATYVSHFNRREPFQMRYRLRRHDGEYRWITNHGVPRFDSDATFTGYIGSCIDMTEQIMALHEARKAKEALENVLSAATEISIIATDPDGLITIFNRGAELMLGYSAGDMIGKQTPAIIHLPEEIAARSQELSLELDKPVAELNVFFVKAAQLGQEKREWTYVRKDQSTLTVSLAVTTIVDENGNITGYLGIAEDISERKQNETLVLQAKNQAETLARSKSEFLANMSHEIRTPMNAIIGLSYLALNKDVPDELRDYLEKINSSSNSLLNILNDILDFSKLEAGHLSIDHSHFDLDETLDNLNNLFADHAAEKQLIFNIEIAPDVPRHLLGDAPRLQQILINLLGNAIKFTERGAVTLKISLQQLYPAQAKLLFCVIDTGIGMSAHDCKKLFQPFSQVDGSITRRFGGSGLGLAISHNLLSLMGGTFSVKSSPGVGSIFSFELAFGLSPSSSTLSSMPTHSQQRDFGKLLAGTRILVVEDNLTNQQVISEFLKLLGISVELTDNGTKVMALLDANTFDAVLMDMHMPEMDGFEATKRIRNQARFANLPVIALTAGVTEEERERCMALGMNDFIAKPINPKKLTATLIQWLKPDDATLANEASPIKPIDSEAAATNPLPLLDISNLLLMINDDHALATRLLVSFIDNMKHLPAKIETLIAAGNLSAAREHLHKIKGAAGNIGAIRLYTASKALEAELKAHLPATTLKDFCTAFEQTLSAIVARQQQAEPLTAQGNGNIEAVRQIAAELDERLKKNDFIPETLLNTLKPYLSADQLDWFTRLQKLINTFQYAEAHMILQQLEDLPSTQEPLND
ncbi:MAG: CHASE domain-containing protein [Methylobacter sp.]